jgi:hypothetical protein
LLGTISADAPCANRRRRSIFLGHKPHDAFDHAAIAVRDRIDEAARAFARLGFTLTPRGHHTLGSINHLIVLQTTYVELIGFPAGRTDVRAELRDAPIGLNGLVFASENAHATHGRAQQRGAPLQPVQEFSRPVELDDGAHDARFRTVRTVPGASPAGRVYFCEHLTPELVWRMPWQWHANASLELTGVTAHVRDLAAFFGELRRVCRDDGLVVISVMHPAMMLKGVQARFNDPRTGARVLPQSVPNQISDYVIGALEAGLRIRRLSEHSAGEDLVARAPRAEKYLGWPMLFLMTATPAAS